MTAQIDHLLDEVFRDYPDVPGGRDLRAEIRLDLMERYQDLRENGLDESTALAATRQSVGDLEQTLRDLQQDQLDDAVQATPAAAGAPSGVGGGDASTTGLDRPTEANWGLRNFKSTVFRDADFHDVMVDRADFRASQLLGADFSGAHLPGALFRAAQLGGAVLRDADLTGADLSAASTPGVVWAGTNLTDAKMSSMSLRGVDFTTAKLVGTKLKSCDLREAVFDQNQLEGVVFDFSNLTGASFRGCVLSQVSFRHVSKRAVASIDFEGATMDRLTHALATGSGALLKGAVTVV
ncbi:MAG: pentapeptide repeat-containing protein [Bifidobacteriaceae bacterium]|jgi:uncharacterized protein YjbI with pentapeptide repeats|nr:pentapeptide repeat-containing protein [Bifidobacteriaceae bacterium]